MIIKTKEDTLWPGQVATDGLGQLEKQKEFDLILTGDNHQSFCITSNGRWLLNPGSMMRMRADQVDHNPIVGIYDTLENTFKALLKRTSINRII